ncbi:MAG: bifunctional precorrin-2 dehydrogenase/sirohydrochlorin ferrochelatase [Methanosarcinales archaeon]|nr:bifunctional precorrin-2 dehydrogenase/sirohydrochlorin ferrochelatase [ANME-2 cluster archaeon]MDF1531137.1 bifunctional precorrin-2 dehydrogenase/sirohydrochlorin ferrochelatase [ANME-2 cluster archaeon]MDW7777185.1 bifunctional precorrin-2 dehydrogenase/sirohydrochlorin ferrochelatase [Methanosarcinales archaeon]
MTDKPGNKLLQDSEPNLFPLMIDMNDRKVVIFGGGKVGERKAALFVRYAPTTVLSRDFTPLLQDLAGEELKLIETTGTLSDDEILDYIDGAFLVIPTTNDREFNIRVANIAHQQSCLVNSVDGLDDCAIPSIVERGNITIAISTRGASPALSKYMRKKIETVIPAEFETMAQLQKEMRVRLKASIPDQRERASILWAILEDEDVWNALTHSYEQALEIALTHISNGNN